MAGKRLNGEGGVQPFRKDAKGKVKMWRGSLMVGHRADGKPDVRYVYGKGAAEMREKLEALKQQRNTHTLNDPGKMTLEGFLTRWLSAKRGELRSSTYSDYERMVNKRIVPALGRKSLQKLTALEVQKLIDHLRDEASVPEARRVLSMFKTSLKAALEWGLVGRNVAQVLKPPRLEREEMKVWEAAQVVNFLGVARAHRLYSLFDLALTTGMRVGELLGLRWTDLKPERSELRIERTASLQVQDSFDEPKTQASKRTVVLSPRTLEMLATHRERQALERTAAGEGYKEQNLVFSSEVGTTLNYSNLRRAFLTLCARAEVPTIRIHDLRHTAASAMIRAEFPVKMVADRLGHTDPAFTLRVYTHVWAEHRREYATSVEELYAPRAVPVNALN